MDDQELQARELFVEAIALTQEGWAELLQRRCGENAGLRVRVQTLLDQYARSGEFLTRPAAEVFSAISGPAGGRIAEFHIVREIGRGGMGAVYLAEDTELKRPVALKVLNAGPGGTARDFRKEAQAAARLSHPGIVQVYRAGEENGIAYIAMELVDGETLRSRMERAAAVPGRALGASRDEIAEAAKLVGEIAEGLDHAHQRGVVHRDIKPSNILIDARGRARLTDFGLARIVSDHTASHPGSLAGSFPYMSPEQARVHDAHIDHRTDLFSLGVVLYELLAKRRPFEGTSPQEIFFALGHTQPKPIRSLNPAVPVSLATICHKAIEKIPRDRYQTAAHLAGDLRCYLSGDPILARPPTLANRLTRWARRRRRSAAAAVMAVLAVALGLTLWMVVSLRRQAMSHLTVEARGAARVSVRAVVTEGRHSLRTEWGSGGGSSWLPLGQYRVTAVSGDQRFTETSVVLDSHEHSVAISLALPALPAETGMVRIPAARHVLGVGRAARDVDLPEFYIDRIAVTNAEYDAFRARPGAGGGFPPLTPTDPAMGSLPVVGITWSDAQAYAAWRGKRLPTSDEWEAAMRFPDARLSPWRDGMALPAPAAFTTQDQQTIDTGDGAELFGLYRRFAFDASTARCDLGPLGIIPSAGNIQEFTDTLVSGPTWQVVVRGSSWLRRPSRTEFVTVRTLPLMTLESPDPASRRVYARSVDTGFRCARSTAPAP